MRSTQGSRGFFLKRTRTRSTSRSMGRRARRTRAGRLRPSTRISTIALTSAITSSPNRNHKGDKPTVAAKMPNAMSMMVAKPESTVICMSNAALVALPGAMPRRRASSTTSVVPARLREGAIVFTKNVPNTSGSVSRGFMCSSTASKAYEYEKLCAKYLPNWVHTAAISGMTAPFLMVSTSSTSWSPRSSTTASTMTMTSPMSRFRMLSFFTDQPVRRALLRLSGGTP